MKGCYSKGGKIRPKTIHGLRTGQHNNPNVLRAARACGGGVMHKDGERPKRADGGSTISEDSKKKAADLRAGASRDRLGRNIMGGTAAVLGVLGSVGNKLQRSGNKPMAVGNAALAYGNHIAAKQKDAEADSIERGEAIPGQEDRKHGGRVGRKNGGPLNAKKRNALPSKDFAGPDRSYPINDANHARNALARASQHASPKLQARIKAKVAKKYPGIDQGG